MHKFQLRKILSYYKNYMLNIRLLNKLKYFLEVCTLFIFFVQPYEYNPKFIV